MLRRVALVKIVVLLERSISIIRVTRIGKLETKFAVINKLSTLRRNTMPRSVLRLLAAANVVPSSSILVTLVMQAFLFSETLVTSRDTPCNILENRILRSRRRENIKSYIEIAIWILSWNRDDKFLSRAVSVLTYRKSTYPRSR
jgi:hypothetical protein